MNNGEQVNPLSVIHLPPRHGLVTQSFENTNPPPGADSVITRPLAAAGGVLLSHDNRHVTTAPLIGIVPLPVQIFVNESYTSVVVKPPPGK